jgi:hypothetical protein
VSSTRPRPWVLPFAAMHAHFRFLGLFTVATVACGGAVSGGVTDAGSSTEGGSSAGGGQTAPSATGSSTGSSPPAASSSGGASGGGPTSEAGSMIPGRGDASTLPSPPCSAGGGGGSAGGGGGSSGAGSCDIMTQQTCSGVSYTVDCACPQGSCACFGATTTVVAFTGCPTCPTIAQANAICGFPN